jgi:hypothetical protein
MSEQKNINTDKKPENSPIKPDVAAGLLVQASLKISDPVTGKILLKTRG